MPRVNAHSTAEQSSFMTASAKAFSRRRLRGYARIFAAPSQDKILAIEPWLRAAIPLLTVIFLLVVAGARVTLMSVSNDEVLERAETMLDLVADKFQSDFKLEAAAGPVNVGLINRLLDVSGQYNVTGEYIKMVIIDREMVVRYAGVNDDDLLGQSMVSKAPLQQLTNAFGANRSSSNIVIGDTVYLANFVDVPNSQLVGVSLLAKDAVLASWRNNLSVNVTLFVTTAMVLMVILYAYFGQIARARHNDDIHADTYERIELALMRGHCGLWNWDMEAQQLYWSRSMYDMLGYQTKESTLSFGDISSILHSADRQLMRHAREVAEGTRDHLDEIFRIKHANGHWVWMRARAQIVDPNSSNVHLIGIAVDVSEQFRLAKQSEQAGHRLNQAIENISEAFVLWDKQGRLIMCNDRFRELTMLDASNLKEGMTRQDVEASMLPIVEENRMVTGAKRHGIVTFERRLQNGRWLQVNEKTTADGMVVSVGMDITALKTNQQNLVRSEQRLIETVRDVSEVRKALEERNSELSVLNEKIEEEKNRANAANTAKSEFLANMSHELRTPLNAILGFSHVMHQELFGPIGNDKYAEYAKDINDSGSYLLGLINDVLDMAKIEAGRFTIERENINFGKIIQDTMRTIELQSKEKNITIETDLGAEKVMFVDKRSLKQIVLNLLSNALKFTPENGRITIRANKINGCTHIAIQDSGCGIEPDALKRLGQPFEQVVPTDVNHNDGSGLGLAISKSLVEMHGGRMRIWSKVNQGTTVAFRIPDEGNRDKARQESFLFTTHEAPAE